MRNKLVVRSRNLLKRKALRFAPALLADMIGWSCVTKTRSTSSGV
jgi:hypothetical protein